MAFPRPEPLGQSSTPQSGAGGFRPTSVYVNGIDVSSEDIGLAIPAGPVSTLESGATVEQVAGAVNDLIAALVTAGIFKAPEPEPEP